MTGAQLSLDGSSSEAAISPCGRYRYSLTRRWGVGAPMLFVMLNPSTADASVDDPTIRRCLAFAHRELRPAIEVVNLFSWRSTDPAALASVVDVVGPEHWQHVEAARDRAAVVVAAWGASVPVALRFQVDRTISSLTERSAIYCLGETAPPLRAPRHPLYVRGDQPLELYATSRAPMGDASPVEASVRAAEAERAARPPTTAGHDAKLVGSRARWRAAYGGGGR